MPYAIVSKEIESIEPERLDSIDADRIFTDRATAHRTCQALQPANTFHVLYCQTQSDRDRWETREAERFGTGEYQPTPWDSDGFECHPSHFAHLSLKSPGKIAYTPTPEHGYQDRQITKNPGRYLEEFYSSIPAERRQAWIERCHPAFITLSIARSADDIERVYSGKDYTNGNAPIRSCMGPTSHLEAQGVHFGEHPTRVYGDSDLGVAYLGPIDRAIARCVVWPDRLRYGRLYGSSNLTTLLEAAGYSHGSMSGAHIRALDGSPNGGDHGSFLMPYIDGCSYCEEVRRSGHRGTWLKLGSGSIDTQTTSGYVDVQQTRCCDHCDTEYTYDEDNDTGYCSSCEDSRQTCPDCDGVYFGDDTSWYYRLGGDYICEACCKADEHTCLGCDDTWHELEEFTTGNDQRRRRDNGSRGLLCRNCEEVYRVCRHCEIAVDKDAHACPDCGEVQRCKHTGDLLAIDLTTGRDLTIRHTNANSSYCSICHRYSCSGDQPDTDPIAIARATMTPIIPGVDPVL